MSMSTSMLRSTWRSASTSSRSATFSTVQPVAGPSRLRFAVPRCTCGEALLLQQHQASNSSRRWMSSTRISYQSTSTIPQSSSTAAPPLHSLNIDKKVPPPAAVEAPPSASITPGTDTSTATSTTSTTPPAPRKTARPARREIKAQKAAITLVSTDARRLYVRA